MENIFSNIYTIQNKNKTPESFESLWTSNTSDRHRHHHRRRRHRRRTAIGLPISNAQGQSAEKWQQSDPGRPAVRDWPGCVISSIWAKCFS